MKSESAERFDAEEDTVICSSLTGAIGPSKAEGESIEIADAQTIVVSRAAPRHSVRPIPGTEEPEQEQPTAQFAMRIGSHPIIPLEVPAYIGRRPSTPRISGLHMPRLVMVPSPTREVSSTHVEILQDASAVVITDLGSTNGTRVTLVGRAPRTLRQGESLVVGAQAMVDIGDGIQIVIVSIPQNESSHATTTARTEGTK